MSRIALRSNPLGTGTFTIESPNSNTDSTIVLPDGGGAIVLTDATQTLTNKSISASQVNSGTLEAARIPNLDASKITTGTVATARLASGTANNTTFLRGDQTWQTINTTPTTDQVLAATAGASVGAVGTYVAAGQNFNRPAIGSTTAGSNLRGFDANIGAFNPGFSGTWRNMGASLLNADSLGSPTLWLRIS